MPSFNLYAFIGKISKSIDKSARSSDQEVMVAYHRADVKHPRLGQTQ